jgi:hypothetical protein
MYMRHTKQRRLAATRPRLGRPPSGVDGEKVSEYRQITIRLPGSTRQLLYAIAGMTGMPIWRVMHHALEAYVLQMPDDERRLLSRVQHRRRRLE